MTEPSAAATLAVTVVTPEGTAWVGRAVAVSVPAANVSLGILPRRQPLATELGRGLVRTTVVAGETVELVVSGGFVVVDTDEVTVIADAILPER